MQRIVGWIAGGMIVQLSLLLLVARHTPGLTIYDTTGAAIGAATAGITIAIGWYPLYRLSARVYPLLFPALLLILSVATVLAAIWVVSYVAPGAIHVATIWSGARIALILATGGVLCGAAYSLRDPAAYDRFVIQPLRRHVNPPTDRETAGILFLEIDGLAEPILQRAIAQGYAPTMRRWLQSGSHRLVRWETDLSSQTTASQAGILLGDNTDIPAFRWYDKARHTLMESSAVGTARELERALSNGHGLLAGGGAARWSTFSGDADDCLGVYSRLGPRIGKGHASYYAFFANPYAVTRMFALFLAEVVRERYQAWRQRIQDVRPRVKRTFRFALVRAGCTVLLQEATGFTLIADMLRGLPAVYATLFAYDEVAHHAGIDRPDALKAVTTLDRLFATLERAAAQAPRPYHLVILSDHGQSEGASFHQRYGTTLADLVQRLLSERDDTSSVTLSRPCTEEGEFHLDAALTEAMRSDTRTARVLAHMLQTRPRRDDSVSRTGSCGCKRPSGTGAHAGHAIATASGNLGLISFPQWPARMTYEQLTDTFPRLLPALAAHPGIACLLVHSSAEGGIVLGARGLYYLDHGYAVGENPLAIFGPNAAAHLKRTDHFTNAADIMVIGHYDPTTGEVAAFEELVGSHGGLGGAQTEPFILYPAVLPFDAAVPIVGAAEVHHRLRPWVVHTTGDNPVSVDADREGLHR